MSARWKRPRKPRNLIEELCWWAQDLRFVDPDHPDAATLQGCLEVIQNLEASCFQQRRWIEGLILQLSDCEQESRHQVEHQARLLKAETARHERLRKAEIEGYEAATRLLRARAEVAENNAREHYLSRVAALDRAHGALMATLGDLDGQSDGARKRMCGANLNSTEKQIVSALLSFASKECPTIAPEDTFEAAIGKVSVAMRALRAEVERLRSGRDPAPTTVTFPAPATVVSSPPSRLNGHT